MTTLLLLQGSLCGDFRPRPPSAALAPTPPGVGGGGNEQSAFEPEPILSLASRSEPGTTEPAHGREHGAERKVAAVGSSPVGEGADSGLGRTLIEEKRPSGGVRTETL